MELFKTPLARIINTKYPLCVLGTKENGQSLITPSASYKRGDKNNHDKQIIKSLFERKK